jgi:hypothetical protein
MSRQTSRPRLRGTALVVGVVVLVAPLADAQTIADYSHAQRVALENAMTQAAARSAGVAGPAPAVAAAAGASSVPVAAPIRQTLPAPAPTPEIQVSGVFAAGGGAVAEVVVNSTPYLLASGEQVPGTPWEVRLVAVDRVVLGRRGAANAVDAAGGLRVFALPTLR